MSFDLSKIPTKELVGQLATRSDLLNKEGMFAEKEIFDFFANNALLSAVDGLPVRKNNRGFWEIGLITRNTGFYKGKLWVDGGRVLLGESNEMALKRHFKSDLGVEIKVLGNWFQPAVVGQYVRDIELAEKLDIGHNPPYQNISPMYLVLLQGEVNFGSTSYGDQEASAMEWFPLDKIPPKEDLAYRGHKFISCAVAFLKENF